MNVRLESVSYTSGDGATAIPSYLATPGAEWAVSDRADPPRGGRAR